MMLVNNSKINYDDEIILSEKDVREANLAMAQSGIRVRLGILVFFAAYFYPFLQNTKPNPNPDPNPSKSSLKK